MASSGCDQALLLLPAGCRIGELCALSWDDADFNEKCGTLFTTRQAGTLKTAARPQRESGFLHMDDRIMNMLSEYRQKYLYGAIKKKEWCIDEMTVFSSTKYPGEYLCPNTVREWIRNFAKKHGLPAFHPHQFRHTPISLQLQAGISFPDFAKRAGHSLPDVTLGIYAHTFRNSDKHISEAVTQAIPQLPKAKEA